MQWELEADFTGVSSDLNVARDRMFELIRTANRPMFYIGISANPNRRAYGHRRVKIEGDIFPGVARKMSVIYETDTYGAVQYAERFLITAAAAVDGSRRPGQDESVATQRYQQSGMVGWNSVGGGGGRIPQHGPFFVYLLIGGYSCAETIIA